MNGLQIFNSEMIPVYVTGKGNKVVIGRELHEALGINSKYADWFKNMICYGFSENTDYSAFSKNLENGGRTIEHIMTLDMAKHIAMIQRTPQGFAIRQKLIELETAVQKMSPLQMLELSIKVQREHENRIAELEETISAIADNGISVEAAKWKKATSAHLADVEKRYCKHHPTFFGQLCKELETTENCDLDKRIQRKRARMKKAGAKSGECMKVGKLDVIAEDSELRKAFDNLLSGRETKLMMPVIPMMI